MQEKLIENKEQIIREMEEFIKNFKSVILGTKSKNGDIDITYAPYISSDGEYYIYISEIGDHYTNLKENNQKFEIMFLQDEKEAQSVLVRKRVRFNVTAEFLTRDKNFESIMDSFEEKIGETFKIVRRMQDFHLVKLNVIDGRFVKGFGQAYNIKDGEVFQITGDKEGRGHR